MQHAYPVHLLDVWTLADGRRVAVRPVLPHDDVAERAFVQSLSPLARWRRFRVGAAGLSAPQAARLTRVDHRQEVAFVATVAEGDANRVVADARYVVADDGAEAAFAIVVADAWGGLGLGARLLALLAQQARACGLRRLHAPVDADNAPMLALAHTAGCTRQPVPGAGLVAVALELTPAQPRWRFVDALIASWPVRRGA